MFSKLSENFLLSVNFLADVFSKRLVRKSFSTLKVFLRLSTSRLQQPVVKRFPRSKEFLDLLEISLNAFLISIFSYMFLYCRTSRHFVFCLESNPCDGREGLFQYFSLLILVWLFSKWQMVSLSVPTTKANAIVWASFFLDRERGKTKQNRARNLPCLPGKIHKQNQLSSNTTFFSDFNVLQKHVLSIK